MLAFDGFLGSNQVHVTDGSAYAICRYAHSTWHRLAFDDNMLALTANEITPTPTGHIRPMAAIGMHLRLSIFQSIYETVVTLLKLLFIAVLSKERGHEVCRRKIVTGFYSGDPQSSAIQFSRSMGTAPFDMPHR
jgi:hypothetical protein